jgi:hypothetical protein
MKRDLLQDLWASMKTLIPWRITWQGLFTRQAPLTAPGQDGESSNGEASARRPPEAPLARERPYRKAHDHRRF